MTTYTPTPEAVEAVAKVVAAAALDWVDVETGGHEHDADCTNWRAYTDDATAALAAAGPLIERAVRERIEAEIDAFEPEDLALIHMPDWREAMEDAARIARGDAP